MKVTIEQLPDCQVQLLVQPDEKIVQDALRQAARTISRNYNVPGFRKGKAPYAAVVRAYGKEVLYEQISEEMGEKAYKQALEESGLKPVGPGSLEDITFDPLVFHFRVPMPPEVDLGDYRSIRVEPTPVEVSDEEIDRQLTALQNANSEWAPVEEAAAEYGDLLTLRIKGLIGDEVIIDEDAFELKLEEESETFPPGFDAQFVGQTSGASISFDLTYPEGWSEARSGQKAHFEADILSVKRWEAPALDDDFALLVGDYDTLDDLKQSIREGIISERQAAADNQYVNDVLQKIVDGAVKISYPPIVVEDMIDRMQSEEEQSLQRIGLPLDEYLRIAGHDKESYREEFRRRAETQVRVELVLEKLAELEGIHASEAEINERIAQVLESSDSEESASFHNLLHSPSGQLAVRMEIVRQKTIERIRDIGLGMAPEIAAEAAAEIGAAVESEAEAAAEIEAEAEIEVESKESEAELSAA